jgi:hypothetical protein
MMEAVCTSEMFVHFNEMTQCYIPEDCNILTVLNFHSIIILRTLNRSPKKSITFTFSTDFQLVCIILHKLFLAYKTDENIRVQ